MGRVRDFFDAAGLEARDLPVAFVLHELISLGLAAASWSLCYSLQPTQTLARALPGVKIRPSWMQAIQASSERKLKWMKSLPMVKGKNKRLAVSLAESTAFRASIKPITFPGKLWASWKLTLLLKNKKNSEME